MICDFILKLSIPKPRISLDYMILHVEPISKFPLLAVSSSISKNKLCSTNP